MARFLDFPAGTQKIIEGDIENAKARTKRCATGLGFRRHQHVQKIAYYCFDIDEAWGEEERKCLNEVRKRFEEFSRKVGQLTFVYVKDPPRDARTYAAFYVHSNPSEYKHILWVTPRYFWPNYNYESNDKGSGQRETLDREATIFHESIHYARNVQDHIGPGRRDYHPYPPDRDGKSSAEPGKLEIPYHYALLNAYCYEYFYKWI